VLVFVAVEDGEKEGDSLGAHLIYPKCEAHRAQLPMTLGTDIIEFATPLLLRMLDLIGVELVRRCRHRRSRLTDISAAASHCTWLLNVSAEWQKDGSAPNP
jgi:hypothetical protein